MNFSVTYSAALFTLCCCFVNCADLSRGDSIEPGDATAASNAEDGASLDGDAAVAQTQTVTFTSLHPLLLAGCRECHRAGGQAANTSFVLTGDKSSDLATTLPCVNRADPANSRLLTKGVGRNHEGGAVWASDAAQATSVLRWIQQGTQP